MTPIRNRLAVKICDHITPDLCQQPDQKTVIYAHLARLLIVSLLQKRIISSVRISQHVCLRPAR